MTHSPRQHRALRGAVDGAVTGLVVASLRVGITIYRKGIPDDWGAVIPDLIGLFLIVTVSCAYIFAIGHAAADGISGSLLGAAIFAVSGVFLGSIVLNDFIPPPYPMLGGGALGGLVGAPVGALIHRQMIRWIRSAPSKSNPD